MNHIHVLRILFCSLWHLSILYPSEIENTAASREKNPLMHVKIYLDTSRKFTLKKAEKIIQKDKKIINSQEIFSEKLPLEWLCARSCRLGPLNKENRLEIAKLFVENDANDESIKKAWMTCLLCDSKSLQHNNAEIKKFLRSTKEKRAITMEVDEIIEEIIKNYPYMGIME